jgi:glutamate/tyrosine decarboxylase-like PLP-dependent enzyme
MQKVAERLQMTEAEFVALGRRVIDIASTHLTSIRGRRVHTPVPHNVRARIASADLPEDGISVDGVISALQQDYMPWALGNDHPRSVAWVMSAAAPIAILADTLARTANNSGAGWEHAGTYLAAAVSRWLMQLVGFPVEGSIGILTSGGTMANMTALAAARHWAFEVDGIDVRHSGLWGASRRYIVYTSTEAHSSVRKTVELLGLGTQSLRLIPSDDAFRLPASALQKAITEDRAAGHRPFCVVAAAGSTNTGSIDPLEDIAGICKEESLWFHADGAYGALATIDDAYTSQFRGVSLADSITFDPHKWLNVPLDCGFLAVRDRALLRRTFSLVPPYLQKPAEDETPWSYEYCFPLTTSDRAVKVWAVLARLGRNGIKEMVTRHNELAAALGRAIQESSDFALVAPVSLSVVCFRYQPKRADMDDESLDTLNQELADRVCDEGNFFLTTTNVRGRTTLRVCFLHYANSQGDVKDFLATLQRAALHLGTEHNPATR